MRNGWFVPSELGAAPLNIASGDGAKMKYLRHFYCKLLLFYSFHGILIMPGTVEGGDELPPGLVLSKAKFSLGGRSFANVW